MSVPGWLRKVGAVLVGWGLGKLEERLNRPSAARPGPDVRPIADADRGRPPRAGGS